MQDLATPKIGAAMLLVWLKSKRRMRVGSFLKSVLRGFGDKDWR